ncbi:MAG TPA: PD-(D/E)XK nuclease family protein [Mycobacteriales bacterium]|nr:PD-(D/E)XK nuclease family protein [Mycobacteriales bacterium]
MAQVPLADEQGELDVVVPPRLFSATPSKLDSWLDCPRRYRFSYVDRPAPPKGPPWAHNSLGAAVHTALAAWWLLPVADRTVSAARRLVHEKWVTLGFRDDQQADDWRERAADMVERYVAGLDPADEPLGVERTVGMKTPRLALSGRIDRLDRRGDELVVVDYKTGRHLLSTDDARGSLALAIYAAAAERTLRLRCRRVELHHLPTGDVVVWEHTEESLARQLGRAESIGVEAADTHAALAAAGDQPEALEALFPTRSGPHCGWCDYLDHCPTGKQAATQRVRSWAGLAPEIVPTVDDCG